MFQWPLPIITKAIETSQTAIICIPLSDELRARRLLGTASDLSQHKKTMTPSAVQLAYATNATLAYHLTKIVSFFTFENCFYLLICIDTMANQEASFNCSARINRLCYGSDHKHTQTLMILFKSSPFRSRKKPAPSSCFDFDKNHFKRVCVSLVVTCSKSRHRMALSTHSFTQASGLVRNAICHWRRNRHGTK